MLPLWIVDVNYNVACTVALIGNALVVILSLKMTIPEIRAYRWIIVSQAATEGLACIMKMLLKFVSIFMQI